MTYTTDRSKINKYKRKWRKNNLDKERLYNNTYRKKNAEKYRCYQREYARKYRKKNKEKVSEINRNWKIRNKEKTREYSRRYRLTPKSRYGKYKRSAKERGYKFELSLNQFSEILFSSSVKCFYCGSKTKLGLDRVNNKIGYCITNIVSACWSCNKLKGIMSKDLYIQLCVSVAKNNGLAQR